MNRRLWVTIVNNETAQQAVKAGQQGALMCTAFFATLTIDAWWSYGVKSAWLSGLYTGLYGVIFLLIRRGAASAVEAAVVALPVALAGLWQQSPMRLGGYWRNLAPLFLVLIGFELLNGMRGVSYLHAPLGLPRRGGDDAQGEIGVGVGPHSPLHPRDVRMPEST